MENIRITNHAIERYAERSRENYYKPTLRIRAELQEMLARAIPENPIAYTEKMRPRENAGQGDYTYLVYGKWLFVLSKNVLITVRRRNRDL